MAGNMMKDDRAKDKEDDRAKDKENDRNIKDKSNGTKEDSEEFRRNTRKNS